MKILFTLLLCIITSVAAFGQSKNGFYVDFSGGFSNEREDHVAQLTPGIGYQFNDKWAAGFRATLQTGDTYHYDSYTPYARFSFARVGNFQFFSEGMLSWNVRYENGYEDDPTMPSSDDHDGFEAGLNVGIQYNVSRHFGFYLSGLYLGYSDAELANKGAVVGNGRFIFDANWRRVALGVRVVF